MSKQKIPLALAQKIAQEIHQELDPVCQKCMIVGSIRRKKEQVGDIEILYIPTVGQGQKSGDLFATENNLCDLKIEELLQRKILGLRPKSDGTTSFGQKVKLLVHLQSGIPLDLFSCQEDSWANNLVSRTGGKDNNIQVAGRALSLGLQWLPFGPGFTEKATGNFIPVSTEKDVYDITKLPFLPPEERA